MVQCFVTPGCYDVVDHRGAANRIDRHLPAIWTVEITLASINIALKSLKMPEVVTIAQPTQPDIQYHPDYEEYLARGEQRQATETLANTLHPLSPLRNYLRRWFGRGRTWGSEITGFSS